MKLQRTEKEWNGTSTPSTANGQESPEKKKGENEAARKLPDIQISPRKEKSEKKRYNPKETKNRKMEPVSALIKFV